ncbi:MAG: type I methionyl aminopeptidase [Myxococcales bacterium]|nr:type I methionyl aminopeptidase [Myxococcales bacterium]
MSLLSSGRRVILKSPEEIELMRQSGVILAAVLDAVEAAVAPGVTTGELDEIAARVIAEAGATASFKGYHGYPKTLCTSVNAQVIHGIPSDAVALAEGDIVSVDCGVYHQGFHADSCRTIPVGAIDAESDHLLKVTREALQLAIAKATPGGRLSTIGATVERHVKKAGLSVVRDYVGHGIGRSLHEDPDVRNYGRPGRGPLLKAGMVLAIEPMVNVGGARCRTLDDGWTVVTRDGSRSAHFEHTVAITKDGPQVLTSGL